MEANLIRTLMALGLTIIMAFLAVQTRAQPYRRAALGLGAVALSVLALYNALPSFSLAPYIALALLVLALAAYVMSWVKGEVLQRQLELRDKMAEEIKRRREKAEKRS